MLIKVCGIKYQHNLDVIGDFGLDMIGLNFYSPSKRYLEDTLDFSQLPESLKKVGVFVKESKEKIFAKAEKNQLDLIQLHGDEEPQFCQDIQDKYPIIKVFRIDESFDFKNLEEFSFADYFLFDTYSSSYGGSGKRFDWGRLKEYQLETPFILSGGIGPRDDKNLKEIEHPKFIGIDVNSGFEHYPGLKDEAVLNEFIKNMRQ